MSSHRIFEVGFDVNGNNDFQDEDLEAFISDELEQFPLTAELELDDLVDEENIPPVRTVAPPVRTVASKRKRQTVATVASKQRVLRWMEEEVMKNGEEKIASKAVKAFPDVFDGSVNAKLTKAARWWKQRDGILSDTLPKTSTTIQNGTEKRHERKVVAKGRGRKRPEWKEWLFGALLDEFTKFLKAGVQFTTSVLLDLALHLIQSHTQFNESYLNPGDGVPIIEKITPAFAQSFCETHHIVVKLSAGRSRLSEQKELFIKRSVSFHLGELYRSFAQGLYNAQQIFNMDETHIVLDMHSPRCLGFRGEDVKLAELVQGGESLTLVLLISGGRHGRIHTPFIIFTNKNRSYPIRGLSDDLPDCTYRSQPKGWMDKKIFEEWLKEERVLSSTSSSQGLRHLFLDNCSSHNPSDASIGVLEDKNIQLHFLPKNATDLCQPLDSFVIKSIKDIWKKQWNTKKFDLIRQNCFSDHTPSGRGWSGKLNNPGKRFFLDMAASVVREANARLDDRGLNLAQKAMIKCGLGVDENGSWKKEMLFPHLQEIIAAFPDQFNGQSPTPL